MTLVGERITAWRAYLYAVSFISLILVIIGAIGLIGIFLEAFIYPPPVPYPQPPRYYYGLSTSAAQVFIGLVVWAYHWSKLQKEERKTVSLTEGEQETEAQSEKKE